MKTKGFDFREGAVLGRVALDIGQARVVIGEVAHQAHVVAQLFSAMASAGINVDLVVRGAGVDGNGEVSATLPKDLLPQAVKLVREALDEIGCGRILRHEVIAKVSIVGAGLKSDHRVAAILFGALAQAGINIEMIATSELTLAVVVALEDAERAFAVACKAFEFPDDDTDEPVKLPFTD